MENIEKVREQMKLLLGDNGVGKSSLISTFVSHHFLDIIPPIMTRIRIPPDLMVEGSLIMISQNCLKVPWKILQKFGYDDKLNLKIPSSFFLTEDLAPI